MFAALVFLVLLQLSPATITSRTISETKTFEDLNVRARIEETRSLLKPAEFNEYHQQGLTENVAINHSDSRSNNGDDHHGKWKLKLLHRDKLPFSHSTNHRQRFEDRMRRDAKRVASLVQRLTRADKAAGGGGGARHEVDDFGSEVVSGTDQGSGEYFVRIGVGSPPRSQYMVIDSGSDIVWLQCQPCIQCYNQSDPVFDPSLSASFTGVSCSSTVCERIDNSGCIAGRCKYEVSYGDGSYTKGTLGLETLSFGRTVVRDLVIGCGHSNRGMFTGAAGLLGLGGGSMSLVSQLGGQTGGAFTYCLASRGIVESGSLAFGREVLPVGAAWVSLLHNPRAPSLYYIGLSGLGVGGMQVPIPEDIFRLNELGYGGVVMDTGTAVTRLPTAAYAAFRDAFVAETASLPRAAGASIFDTCYDLNGFVTVRVPTVSLFLSGGPILTLPANNFLIPVDENGTFCFAFAPSPSGLSIIGNIQQEGIQISVDDANGYVGFGPNVC